MRRTLFTLAAGASAVLCVAVCVLWVRSYWVSDVYIVDLSGRGQTGLVNEQGTLWMIELLLDAGYRGSGRFRSTPGYKRTPAGSEAIEGRGPLGFGHARKEFAGVGSIEAWGMPHWSLVSILLLAPGFWLWRRRRDRMVVPPTGPAATFPVLVDGPGRYRVSGVDRDTRMDTVWHCHASSASNAQAKGELEGIIVTRVERVGAD